MEQSITLIAQAYIAAKKSYNLALIYDACSPIMECTSGFILILVYNVINTSIQYQNHRPISQPPQQPLWHGYWIMPQRTLMPHYGMKRVKWFWVSTVMHLTSRRRNPAVALADIYFWYHPTTTTPKTSMALFTSPVKSSKTWCQRLLKPNAEPSSSTTRPLSHYGSHLRKWDTHSRPPLSKSTISP